MILNMELIALLPDEVILKIFNYLDIIDLIHCGQVSKRFREISQDETLQKLNLDEREVPSNFLKLLISRGLKYLSFFRAKAIGQLDIEKADELKVRNFQKQIFPKNNIFSHNFCLSL